MQWRDTDLENRMGRLLQAGVLVATLAMATGGVLYLARYGGQTVSDRNFHAADPELKTIGGVLHAASALHPAAVIQLGVLLMIATPVLRVAFAIFGFARERDWLYTLISAIVLGLLSYGLFG